MTGPTPPTVEEGMREAVARAIYDVGNKALATALWDGWEPLPIEQDERTYRLHLEYADALLSGDGPIASALAARERERDEARAERDHLRKHFDSCALAVDHSPLASYPVSTSIRRMRSRLETAEAENATLRASAERMEADHAEEIARLHVLLDMSPDDDPFTRSVIEQNHRWIANCVEAQRQHVMARAAAPEPSAVLTPKEPDHG